MRFANPDFLWLLLFLPIGALYLYFFRALDLPELRFSSLKKLAFGLHSGNVDKEVLLVGALRLTALLLLILALARPQKGLRSEELTTKATDILICLDASRSMLSVDFKPQNRFQVAKTVIAEFAQGRQHDRLGMVVFGEYAVTQCPLTIDKSAFLHIIDGLQVGVVAPDQTAIGVGLATSVNRLKGSQAKSKVVILLTDGANNAGTIDPLTAAKTAASYNIKIYSIGAGSPDGGLMPVDDPLFGQRLIPIKSDLDEDLLLKIASETGGKYFRAKSEGMLKTIFQEIDALEKTDIKVKEYVDYKELYVGFLLLAIAFLLAELSLSKTLLRTLP